MPDNKTTCANNDFSNLDDCADNHHTLGHILRLGGSLQRRSARPALHRSVARVHERRPVLPHRKHGFLLHTAHDTNYHVLRPHLDKSLETKHTHGHEGCPNGAHAAEIQGESGKNAGGGGNSVRRFVAASVRHFCQDKIRGRY